MAEYSVENYQFNLEAFVPLRIFDQLTDVRVDTPEIIERQAIARKRHPRLTLDGGKMMFRLVPDDERTLWQLDIGYQCH
ncbi:MAG: hypothetical protein PVH17_12165 [Anaerolineae bacterium]|jgi:hypothetical protein